MIDWGVLEAVDEFMRDRISEPGGSIDITGDSFRYLNQDRLRMTLAEALDEMGDRRSGAWVVDVLVHSVGEDGPLSMNLLVHTRSTFASTLRVRGMDEVEVRGVAETFRQRFLIDTRRGPRWNTPKVEGESRPSRWQRFRRHPLYVEAVGGAIAVVLGAVLLGLWKLVG